jgi:threonine synthase
MKLDEFPVEIQPYVMPQPGGKYVYRCFSCHSEYGVEKLLYTCPECGSVLMIKDLEWQRLKEIPGSTWRKVFDYRSMLTLPELRGIYRYHELLGSLMPLDSIVYLGEGHTPVVAGNDRLCQWAGMPLSFKNDGQNPSASFKDRGMASAFSYLKRLIIHHGPCFCLTAKSLRSNWANPWAVAQESSRSPVFLTIA